MIFLDLAVSHFGVKSFVDGLVVAALVLVGYGAIQILVYSTFEGPEDRVCLIKSVYQIILFTLLGGA